VSDGDMTRGAVAGTRGADRSGTGRIGADRSGTERISVPRGAVRTSVHGGVQLHDRAGDEEAEGGIAAEAHLLRRLREREQGRGPDGSTS